MASSIDYTRGPARVDLTAVDATELDARKRDQLLVEDLRRSRPLYFDGRFLAARDLTREQVYALTREADLSAAHHGGVIRGLELGRFGDGIRVSPGTGFTPNGELVALASTLTAAIAQIPEDDRIDLSHGLTDVAEPPARGRTGLYLLGLRPGEYATNPTTRYPLTVRGKPGIEDGDLVEAVSLALHPLRFDRAADPLALRGDLARTAFFEGDGVAPPDLLALAVVYLSGGSIAWIDPHLVRRDVAADDAVAIGLGDTQRSLREAHFRQYDRQLAELVGELRSRGGLRFPASRYFRCLPPIGRMPVAALDQTDFTQVYFPPQMTVSLGVVVDHELPALLEQSMQLPAIDLEGTDDDFDFTYVQVLVPMSASAIDRLRLQPVALVPRPIASPAILTKRLPIAAFRDFLIRRKPPVGPDFGDETRAESAPLLAAWRNALAAAPDQMVWYVRVPSLSTAPVAAFDRRRPPRDDPGGLGIDKAMAAEKAAADKPAAADKSFEKADDKSRVADKVPDKAADKAADKSVIADKIRDKGLEKAPEKSVVADKSVIADKGLEKAPDKTFEKTAEKTVEKTFEKTAEKTLEKGIEKTAEKTLEKTADKTRDTSKPIADAKTGDVIVAPIPRDVATPVTPGTPTTPTPTVVAGPGRTFIQPVERPDVGGGVIRKPRDT